MPSCNGCKGVEQYTCSIYENKYDVGCPCKECLIKGICENSLGCEPYRKFYINYKEKETADSIAKERRKI